MEAVSLLDGLPDLVFVLDPDGRIVLFNDACLRLLRWQREDWVGRSVLDLVHPDDAAGSLASISALEERGPGAVGTPVEMRVRDVDGGWHWMEVIGVSHVLEDGRPGLLCAARDITLRRMWEVAAGDVARFQQVLQHAPSITMLLDEDGVVTSVNAAFARLLGHDPSLVIGLPFAGFVDERSQPALREAMQCLRGVDRSTTVELWMRTANQSRSRPIRFDLVDHCDDPVVHGIIGSGYDITELQLVRHELEFIANHDALTGLANRNLLLRRLGEMLTTDVHIAVLFIDLDRFKPINDLYGHEVGDVLLQAVAARLVEVVRFGDVVARVGGDEFVTIAPNIGDWSTARELAERIEAALAVPYLLSVGPVRIGASVGAALSDSTSTVAGLLSDADVQMYDTKSERRGADRTGPIERRRRGDARRRLAIELAAGIGRGDVVAHLQPVIDLRTGMVVGMEALARWNHSVHGVLRPSAFMDLVADAGLDVAFGDAVLVSACRTLRHLRTDGHDLELCINLSIGQLGAVGLSNHIAGIAVDSGLAMSKLVVEVTERETLSQLVPLGCPAPDETLADLHRAGASLSLDDFGTGHSSLTHVRRFPLSSIKIDRTFVGVMDREPQDRAVVEVVLGMAKAFGLRVIAEGVENHAQMSMLRALGCDRAQGYFFGRPMDADTVRRWMSARRGAGSLL